MMCKSRNSERFEYFDSIILCIYLNCHCKQVILQNGVTHLHNAVTIVFVLCNLLTQLPQSVQKVLS